HLLVEAEVHGARRLARGGLGIRDRRGLAVLGDVRHDLHLALEILLALPALGEDHAVAVLVRLAVLLDLEVRDTDALGRRARRHDVAKEAEVFLHRGVLLLELCHAPRELALRGALDLQLPVAFGKGALRGLELLPDHAVLLGELGDVLLHLLDVGARDAVAVLDEPPDHRRHERHHQHVEEPAPVPRVLRPDRHARRADAEAAADAAPEAAHRQGTTASCSRPCDSGNPNMRFMFCTAWPAAPFTRLSSTASTTSVCASMGRWIAMRHWLVPRTHRVSGCE